MKSSIRDQVEGEFRVVMGTVRELGGKLTNHLMLEAEGDIEKATGKVQEKVGQVKKVVGK